MRRNRLLPRLPPVVGAVLLATVLAGCAPWPQRAGIPTRWEPSPNFDARRVNVVVIHYTSNDTAAEAMRTLTSRDAKVSAHYLIDRDGSIVQLVDERSRAWHAGDSRWGATTDLNSSSIGIELDNNGREPYPPQQLDALLRLLTDLRQRHRFPAANVIGHSDIAPTRKVDPGPLFPWRLLASHGFGLWCDVPAGDVPDRERPSTDMLPGADPVLGLRAIGYDTSQPAAAIAAFRLHYRPDLPLDAPIERDAGLIRCLADAALKR